MRSVLFYSLQETGSCEGSIGTIGMSSQLQGYALHHGQSEEQKVPSKPIVIIEDDRSIAQLIEYNIKREGFLTAVYASGDLFLRDLGRFERDGALLFILDIMMPGTDGFEVCRLLRKNPVFDLIPILMLTARSLESDKVQGLDLGADDYLTKPFGVRELISRVNNLVRRYAKITVAQAEEPVDSVISVGPVTVDDARHRVYVNGDEVEMTNREYELLRYLMRHKGIACGRDELLNRVWGFDYIGETRTVDVHIRQLRRKLADDENDPLIETVRGHGYRFRE